MDEKYIILTRDPHWLISKCGKKTIILYCTGRICLFGQAIDGDMNNCNPGNLAMSLIAIFTRRVVSNYCFCVQFTACFIRCI
ncbi:unnamed protein product [Heterobilharzia americana]|nr:unnamed protein product [Heterobilharzia americana]